MPWKLTAGSLNDGQAFESALASANPIATNVFISLSWHYKPLPIHLDMDICLRPHV
jgi:hypothetical protein